MVNFMPKRPMLTIMTCTIPSSYQLKLHEMRREFHRTLRLIKEKFMKRPHYGGHFAVTRSLIEGLSNIGADFNYNPFFQRQLGKCVLVLSDLEALRQAILWKREGKISKLLAGPNLVVLPSDCLDVITAKEIDCYLVNSDWTYKAYTDDAPQLKQNCKIWAAGVDTNYWTPNQPKDQDQVLIYQKNAPHHLLTAINNILSENHYNAHIMSYGEYQHSEFLENLKKSKFAVFLSQFESQGIALAEAWSTDVPTLVWNPDKADFDGKTLSVSSAPYLSKDTGLFFSDEYQFRCLLNEINCCLNGFKPREWVIGNMSDQVCAHHLLQIIDKL